MTTQIDEQIASMFAKVNERKATCKELRRQIALNWKTNCSFTVFGGQASMPVHIQTASVEMIEVVATSLCLIIQGRTAAEDQLGVKMSTPNIQGYVADDWFSDLKKRLASINIREEEKALEALEARLNGVLSPEARRQLEVAALAKDLGM